MSDKSLEQILAEISKRAESASDDIYTSLVPVYDSDGAIIGMKAAGPVVTAEQALADAELFTHARTDVPALIEALKRAIEQRDNEILDFYVNSTSAKKAIEEHDSKLAEILKGKV